MSDVKVKHEVDLTRQQAAHWLGELVSSLGGDGSVSLDLGGSSVKLAVPGRLRCEAEVEVDGDEVEVEIELKWTTASSTTAEDAETARAYGE